MKSAFGRIRYTLEGGLSETIQVIRHAFMLSLDQVQDVAKALYTGNLEQDARNVYTWIHHSVQYKRDVVGTEEIRTAARSWNDRHSGVDCEDMTILACAILTRMGYKPVANIIAQNGSSSFSHIFCTVGNHARPDNTLIQGYSIDPVPPLVAFDEIAPNITKAMKINLLEGIQGVDSETGPMLYGLGSIASVNPLTRKLQERQTAIIQSLQMEGLSGLDKSTLRKDLRKTRVLLLMNGTPEQEFAARIMPYVDDINARGEYVFRKDAPLEAIDEYLSGVIEADLLDGDDHHEYAYDDLGALFKKKRTPEQQKDRQQKKTVLNTIFKKKTDEQKQQKKEQKQQKKQDPKKPGLLKKIGKGIVRFNPATIAARNGLLLAMRSNLFKLASRLKFGYLTESEAKTMNLDLAEWNKVRDRVKKTEALFTTIGGKPENLKAAIIKGGGGIDTLDGVSDLGEPVTVASTGAAATLIAKITAWLKDISFKKLVQNVKGKVKDAAQNLFNKKQQEMPEVTPESSGFTSQQEQDQFNKEVVQDLPQIPESDDDGDGSGDGGNAIIWIGLAAAVAAIFLLKS